MNSNYTKEKQRERLPKKLSKDLQNLTVVLSKTVEFITTILEDDLDYLKKYYRKYGDLKYRPPLPNGEPGELGDPQNVDLVMKADTLGMTLKRVVDTISTIETKLASLKEAEEKVKTEPTTEADQQKEAEEKRLSAKEKAAKLLEEAKKNKE
jgi:hypothetical protein